MDLLFSNKLNIIIILILFRSCILFLAVTCKEVCVCAVGSAFPERSGSELNAPENSLPLIGCSLTCPHYNKNVGSDNNTCSYSCNYMKNMLLLSLFIILVIPIVACLWLYL